MRLLSLAIVAGLPVAATIALAQTPEAADASSATATPDACGFKLSAPAIREWVILGGKEGRLGCPTADESAALPSIQGSASRETPFGDQGAIFVMVGGPRDGQAVAIANCYRLFYQYGGAAGWLGLPLQDALNTPDGQKQPYEGGEMRFGRALDSCDATAASPAP